MTVRARSRAYSRTLAARQRTTRQPVTTQYGTVKSFVAGTSVTVTVDGNDLVAPYQAAYNPANGDVVRVDFRGNSPLVVDRVVGVTLS